MISAAFLNKPHTVWQRGPGAQGRAQSALSWWGGEGGGALVGCCGDEKPFHPAVFQTRLCLCLITGPGAALRARLIQPLEKKPRVWFSRHSHARGARARASSTSPPACTRTHSCRRVPHTDGVNNTPSCCQTHTRTRETLARGRRRAELGAGRSAGVGPRRRWETLSRPTTEQKRHGRGR